MNITKEEIITIISNRIKEEKKKHDNGFIESWELIAAGKIYSSLKDIIINKLENFSYDDEKYADVKEGIDLAIKIVMTDDKKN